MRRPYATLPLLLLLLLVTAACGDRSGPRLSSGDLAVAGDLRFSIEDAATMLAPVETLPADPEVVRALAEFWTDYTLLALLVNREGDLEDLDLSAILEPQESQSMVLQLRDAVIDENIEISDTELESVFESERPGEEVRARHILLLFPPDATQAQRDSVRALAEDLRQRAVGGADFAALATEWSGDPGSAQRGGDLDYFPRGIMVAPFEEAAFSTPPGQVSDIVESQFGLHIIRVEDIRSPSLDEIREELRASLRQERVMQAESIFVADIEGAANLRTEEGAAGTMREVAEGDTAPLTGRAASRPLVRYEGGAFTAADFQDFLATQPANLRMQIAAASDEDLEGLLDNLVRSELLVAEARRRGIEPDAEESRTVSEGIRAQYRQFAESIGIADLEPAQGETLNQAVDRRIREVLELVIRGETDVFPLQGLSLPLRARYGAAISDDGVERTAARVEALRAEGGAPDGEESDAPEAPPAAGGSGGDEGGMD